MPSQWERLDAGDFAIAHLSDLHIGSNNWEKPWKLVDDFLHQQLKPSLVLVTGDLVDSPVESYYKEARKALEGLRADYYVCPGNHDRYIKGTKSKILRFFAKFKLRRRLTSSAMFDAEFSGKILLPHTATEVTLRNDHAQWKIGLLGVDSSSDADWAARGYVSEEHFTSIPRCICVEDNVDGKTVKTGRGWDLSIFLVHHHLLSVRGLEAKRRGRRHDLANLTCLVNCGSLLETLSESQMDLVLHGHEHEPHWATYRSLAVGSGQVHVVGAGSATGNDSFEGCHVARMTFNVVILSPDRTARLRRLVWDSNAWRVADELRLFDSPAIRHSYMRREVLDISGEVKSEITKFVEFTRDRDIWVRWTYTDWRPALEFEQEVYNSTGVLLPEDIKVRLFADGVETHVKNIKSSKADKDHTWLIKWTLPENCRGRPVTLEMVYCWRGGAALTEAELKPIQIASPGELRREGLEFATVWAPGAVASAGLVVLIPPEYAPVEVEVRVRDNGKDLPFEANDARQHLRVLSPGRYSLRVLYPRLNYSYSLAWKPLAEEPGGTGQRFRSFGQTARSMNEKLLEAFGNAFADSVLREFLAVSIYLPGEDSTTLQRIAHIAPAKTGPAFDRPPEQVKLAGSNGPLARAWLGVASMVPRTERQQDAAELGFMKGERWLFGLPLRFSFDWTNPPPWGVIRVSVADVAPRSADTLISNPEKLWALLSAGTMRLLTEALQRGKV